MRAIIATAILLGIAGSADVRAQMPQNLFRDLFAPPQAAPRPRPAPRDQVARRPATPSPLETASPEKPAAPARRALRCGMTVVTVDPAYDSQMRHPVTDEQQKSRINAARPPACAP